MPAGLYSQVNLRTGRVLTTVPLTGWGGIGPGMYFALYHNMTSPWTPVSSPIIPLPQGSSLIMGDANGDGDLDDNDIDPFVGIVFDPVQTEDELLIGDFDVNEEVDVGDVGGLLQALEMQSNGPQWTHSYSAHLIPDGDDIILVRDDGTRDIFVGNAQGGFNSPAGVFDLLTVGYNADGDPEIEYPNAYVLTSKSQSKAVFEPRPEGDPMAPGFRLWLVADASGNRLTCQYGSPGSGGSSYKLLRVEDRAFRRVSLYWRSDGRLKSVTVDNVGLFIPGAGGELKWDLRYEGDGIPADICFIPVGEDPQDEGPGAFSRLYFPITFGQSPCRHSMSFSYTPVWELSGITDKNGNSYQFQYVTGRLTRITDPVDPANPNAPRLKQEISYAPGAPGSQVTT